MYQLQKRICLDYLNGMTSRQLAKKHEVSLYKVRQALLAGDVPLRSGGGGSHNHVLEWEYTNVNNMFHEGASIYTVAEHYGVDVEYIQKVRTRYSKDMTHYDALHQKAKTIREELTI